MVTFVFSFDTDKRNSFMPNVSMANRSIFFDSESIFRNIFSINFSLLNLD
ncbi:hypothetical protein [Desulfonauticus submarinus]|nr:hypothetical protein [Desulfonauticus submarinus]